ncbi:uncharacterized protein LOC135974397 isoform X2 [Chrysemys picta bellii]|uniref:uncharacterized protein LOC135974397 isoform X2 n=1 Tax=Chrysemys picta bellii TaxID=8478 RepID=UPI0032B1A147
MSVVAAFLRKRRMRVFLYLDDWLLAGRSEAEVRSHVTLALQMFGRLGLLVNVPKSTLAPTQRLDFIGAVLDSVTVRAILPESRFLTIQRAVSSVQKFPTTTARCCMQLLGHMAACTHVVRHARLRLRPLQLWFTQTYRPNRDPLDLVVTIPDRVFGSLRWWLDQQQICEGIPFTAPQPTLTLVTDASDLGWGAHLGELRTQGLWSREDRLLHINLKELRAVRLACQTFHTTIEGHSVAVLTDNTTAMFYINKQGGSRSSPLCREALQLWDFCIAHAIHLIATYFPGIQNGLADRLSRSYQMHKWALRRDVLHSIFRRWGFPRVDLFATKDNSQCPQFCSFQNLSPGSLADAFTIPWGGSLRYAFPPFPLIHKVLLKTRRDRATIILIAPAWPRQHWFTTLLELSIVDPITLPLHRDLVTQDRGRLLHPNLSSLHLTAWYLSG